MKKFLLALSVAVVATLSFASVSEAHMFWHPHHDWHHGPFFGGIIFDAGPRYISDDEGGDCFLKKVRSYDDYGNLYLKTVRVCD
jgi:hypothetical protein